MPNGWWLWEDESSRSQRQADDFGKLAETIKQKADADLLGRTGRGILDNLYSAAERGLGLLDEQRQSAQSAAEQFGSFARERLEQADPQESVRQSIRGNPALGAGLNPLAGTVADYAVDQGSKLLEANKLGWQRPLASLGIANPLTPEEDVRSKQVSRQVIEENPLSPLPFGFTPATKAAEQAVKPAIPAIEETARVGREAVEGVSPRVKAALEGLGIGKAGAADDLATRSAAIAAEDGADAPFAAAGRGAGEMLPEPKTVPTAGSRVTQVLRSLGIDGPRAQADEAASLGAQPTSLASNAPPSLTTDRYYHGTGSDFARPDPGKFDPNGLFGPGYYLSDDPRPSGGYAEARTPIVNSRIEEIEIELDQLRDILNGRGPWANDPRQRTFAETRIPKLERELATLAPADTGPNIRPVDVPRDLRLLDADALISPAEQRRILEHVDPEAVQMHDWLAERGGLRPTTGDEFYEELRSTPSIASRENVNRLLRESGYDGIRYAGGKRIPMMDEAGAPIEHNAVVIFPESLDKIRNATAGTPGGLLPGSTGDAISGQKIAQAAIRGSGQGALAGGIGASQEEDADLGDVALGALQGAGLGAANRSARSVLPGLRRMESAAVARAVAKTPDEPTPIANKARGKSAADVIAEGARPITASVDDEIKRLRLDKEPPELQDIIRESLESSDFAKEQRRGVIPDEVAQAAADRVNMSIDDWIKGGKKGKTYSEEQLLALRNAGAAQARKVSDLSKEIIEAESAGQVTDLLKARMAVEGKRLNDFLTTVKEPARAESGRGLQAWRFDAREFESDPSAAIERIYKRMGGKENVDQAVQEFTKLTEADADPITMATFWAKVEKPPPGFTDWFKALRYNSMLSGPRTFEINALGSLIEVPWKLGRDIAVSSARGHPGEVVPELAGMWAGAHKGAAAFMQTLKHGITQEQALAGDLPRSIESRLDNPAAKRIAGALELPGRINAATDEYFKALTYGMQLGREAALQARREGVSGRQWSIRVAELLENPTDYMQKQALRTSERMTFKGDMGGVGQGLEAAVQKSGVIGHIIMPFLRTTYHLTARGIERTPIGLAGLGVDVVRGKYKAGAPESKGLATVQERLSEAIPGSMVTLWLMGQAASGNISAAGPDDDQKKKMLQAQGWQPYSIKMGDKWVSYANWGAFAMPLSLAASSVEAHTYKEPDASMMDVAQDTFRRLAETMTEQTYLKGMGTIFQAMRDPTTYGGKFLTDTLTTLIPFGAALNTVGQAMDPVQRRPDRGDVGQAVKARLPGLREQVPVATDLLGKPISNQQTGIAALNPLRVTKQKEDAMLKEFGRVGVDFGTVQPEIAGEKLYGADVGRYKDRAQLYRAMIASQMIETQAYKNASDEDKARMLRNAMTRGAAWASHEVRPGARQDGREFISVANNDLDTAVTGYLRAVGAQRQIDELKQTRYVGYSGEDAEQIARDRSNLSAFRDQFGEAQGDSVFISRYGVSRYAKAKNARANPAYRLKVEQIERSNPEIYAYLRQNPTTTELAVVA